MDMHLTALYSSLVNRTQAVLKSVCDELHRLLYVRPVEELAHELGRRHDAHPTGGSSHSALALAASQSSLAESTGEASRLCLKVSTSDEPFVENGRPVEDASGSTPIDADPVQYLAVLTEAAAVLGKLGPLADDIRDRLHKGLARQVTSALIYCKQRFARQTTQDISDGVVDVRIGSLNARRLVEALYMIFRLFRTSATLHAIVERQLIRLRSTYRLSSEQVKRCTGADVWHAMQTVLIELLNDYFGVSARGKSAAVKSVHDTMHGQSASAGTVGQSLATYFAKKRGPSLGVSKTVDRVQQAPLFRFENTAHSASARSPSFPSGGTSTSMLSDTLSLVNDHTYYSLHQHERVWLCAPDPGNVALVYRPTSRFAVECANRLCTGDGGEDGRAGEKVEKLSEFLNRFVEDVYIDRVRNELLSATGGALAGSDSYYACVTTDEQAQLGASSPVLSSSAHAFRLCASVAQLMHALPPFAHQLAAVWVLILLEYWRCTHRVYEFITRSAKAHQQNSIGAATLSEWRKISAAWAVDEDISRLLKSLPNWTRLVAETNNSFDGFSKGATNGLINSHHHSSVISPPTGPATPLVESAAEIRARTERESEILISNLGPLKRIEDGEVIMDMQHVKSLANMHESLQWFAAAVRKMVAELPPATKQMLKSRQVTIDYVDEQGATHTREELLSEALAERLTTLDEMAATCLLMLHLEARVHCFYYLLPLARQSSHVVTASESQEPDQRVVQLNQDVVKLHELLGSQLGPNKVRYIFEGLGHLVSMIFVRGAHYITKINDNGKKRMCRNIFSLQQALSNVTRTSESDLDLARRFFELLYKSPDEILAELKAGAHSYTELEYRDLVALAVRSHPTYSNERGALDAKLNKLDEIMASLRQNRKQQLPF